MITHHCVYRQSPRPHNPDPSVVLAGSPHWSSLPAQNPSEHPPIGRGDKYHLQVGDRYREEEKASHHTCWCIAFYGMACHILLLLYEHPHRITSTKQDTFISLYPPKNNPLAKICTHPLKTLQNTSDFPQRGFFKSLIFDTACFTDINMLIVKMSKSLLILIPEMEKNT